VQFQQSCRKKHRTQSIQFHRCCGWFFSGLGFSYSRRSWFNFVFGLMGNQIQTVLFGQDWLHLLERDIARCTWNFFNYLLNLLLNILLLPRCLIVQTKEPAHVFFDTGDRTGKPINLLSIDQGGPWPDLEGSP
jgi:hypothetical protein